MKRTARRGFTLLEIMVVVGIIAILAGLSVAAYSQVGSASAPRNAINDLMSNLVRARALATEQQSDVWVIVYPALDKKANSAAGGPGAYFMYQDKAGTFNITTSGNSAEAHYLTAGGGTLFDPLSNAFQGSAALEGQLIDKVYFDDYPGANVIFALPNGGITMGAAQAPFNGMTVGSSCTFCTGTPLRGAVVFGADGSARFVDGAGGLVSGTLATAVSRAQALTIKDRPTPVTETRAYTIAISGPTAFIGSYSMR